MCRSNQQRTRGGHRNANCNTAPRVEAAEPQRTTYRYVASRLEPLIWDRASRTAGASVPGLGVCRPAQAILRWLFRPTLLDLWQAAHSMPGIRALGGATMQCYPRVDH